MKRYSALAVMTLVLAAAVACSQGAGDRTANSDSANDKQAIDKLRSDYAAAWTAGDAGAIAGLYADDAMAFPGNQPTVTGRDDIRKYNEGFFMQFSPGKIDLAPEETTLMGDWAFDRGTYHIMATPKAGGDALDQRGRYLVILHRQNDGSWKVARDFDNMASEPATPAPSQ